MLMSLKLKDLLQVGLVPIGFPSLGPFSCQTLFLPPWRDEAGRRGFVGLRPCSVLHQAQNLLLLLATHLVISFCVCVFNQVP